MEQSLLIQIANVQLDQCVSNQKTYLQPVCRKHMCNHPLKILYVQIHRFWLNCQRFAHITAVNCTLELILCYVHHSNHTYVRHAMEVDTPLVRPCSPLHLDIALDIAHTPPEEGY